MFFPIPTLRFASLFDTLSEVIQQIMWKHELIYLLFRLAGVVLIVNAVVLKPFGLVH